MFGHDLASGDSDAAYIRALFEQGKEGKTEAGCWVQTVFQQSMKFMGTFAAEDSWQESCWPVESLWAGDAQGSSIHLISTMNCS